jgi:hypothetical protein
MRQIHRPANPCQQMWEAMVATAEQSIAGRRLVGFHAARLTAEEIADIKASGLKGPERRFPVRPSVEARDKREHAVALLRASNLAAQPNRSGQTCFCFKRTIRRSAQCSKRSSISRNGLA